MQPMARSGLMEDVGRLFHQNIESLPDGQAHMWSSDEADPIESPLGSFEGFLQDYWDAVTCVTDIGSLQADPIILLESPGLLDDNAGEEKGFLDTLKLYSGLHNNCTSTTLDLLTDAGRYKVRVICELFDELNQAALALQVDTSHASSADVCETKIIAAALSEAIQVCIAIIQYNFQLHQSARPDSRNDGVPRSCICLASADEKQLGIQQDCLELLIRLEFFLIRFRYVMSKVECLDAAPHYNCWISAVSKVDTARSQLSALLNHFRNFGD